MIERITFSLIGRLLFPLMLMAKDYRVIDFGAVGNGTVDDAIAIQKAVDACSHDGGGNVIFSSDHTFLSGPVELKSNVHVILETNATWKANPDERIYHKSAFGKNEGEGNQTSD